MIVVIVASHCFLHIQWQLQKFLPKEKNNLSLGYTTLRVRRLVGDVPGLFVRTGRFDIGFSPRLSLSNHRKCGIDADSGDPCGELTGPPKSPQVQVSPEQRLLHCIFGIVMVTDNTKNPSPDTLRMPLAELSKSIVIT